jgi:hypothetical protein
MLGVGLCLVLQAVAKLESVETFPEEIPSRAVAQMKSDRLLNAADRIFREHAE